MTASVGQIQLTHFRSSRVTECTKEKSCMSTQGMLSGKIRVSLYSACRTHTHTHTQAQRLPYIALDVSEGALSSQSFPAAS